MPQLINGNGPQILTAGSSLVSAPAQSANGLELATMSNVKSLLAAAVAQATTSGTSVDFLAIPAAAKRITLSLAGVSTNGASTLQVQLGTSAGIATTGYLGAADNQSSGGGSTLIFTTGLGMERAGGAAFNRSGIATFVRVSGNLWVGSYLGAQTGSGNTVAYSSTFVTLAGELDRIRITTSNGTDTFDAGSANILMEF